MDIATRNRKIRDLLQRKTDEICETAESARRWLIKTGIYNENGELTSDLEGREIP